MFFINVIKKASIVIGIIFLVGCTTPRTLIKSLDEVKPTEIIYLGKISFSPHIKKDEIITKNIVQLGARQDLHDVLYIKADDTYYDLQDTPGGKGWEGLRNSIVVKEGKDFYVTWEKGRPLNIMGVTFIKRWTSKNRELTTFLINKGLKVTHSGKSKVVYIGDITFKRDEFFNILDIKFNQKGYKKARKAFQKKFKTKLKVEKAKLQTASK